MRRTVLFSLSLMRASIALVALSSAACMSDTAQESKVPEAGTSDESDADTRDGGDVEVRDDAGSVKDSRPLMPWKEGNRWTYRVLSNGVETTKVVTIGAQEPVGGTGPNSEKIAFKVVTTKGASDRTESWRAVLGQRVVRYRELSFSATTQQVNVEEHWDPYKIYVDGSDERIAEGASWVEEYQETKQPVGLAATTLTKRDRWTVDSPREEVTVPAGTFQAIVLQKAGGTSIKTYWFVPGVGKVKETGGQTEELVSYEVSP